MRFLSAAALVISLASCTPLPPPQTSRYKPTRQASATAVSIASPSATPTASASVSTPAPPEVTADMTVGAARYTRRDIAGITFEGVAFDSRKDQLVVVDQARGPGSQFEDSAAAAGSRGGIAAINAGFFTPEGTPLGLVVAAGKTAGSWNSSSSLGSGIWATDSMGSSSITRRAAGGRAMAATMKELIQAGPLLIENSHTVSGLDALKSSPRSLILWDGGNRWWMGRASACSLLALGEALASSSPTEWRIRHALNFDGGRSADLWVSSALAGESISRRSLWNRPVRNFLVLVAK